MRSQAQRGTPSTLKEAEHRDILRHSLATELYPSFAYTNQASARARMLS